MKKIIKLLFFISIWFLGFKTEAATLYFRPAQASYGLGQRFILEARLKVEEPEVINAVEVKIHYPNEFLTPVDFSLGDSILTFISEPEINQAKGEINFAGIIPGGYFGPIPGNPSLADILIKIVFQTPGNVILPSNSLNLHIDFDPNSKAYLNDSQGSLAQLQFENATISLNFNEPIKSDDWLSILKNDKTPPADFSPQITSAGGQNYLIFQTEDKESGLDHYELIKSPSPISEFKNLVGERVTSPYLLTPEILKYHLYLKAVDKAGNERYVEVNPQIKPIKNYFSFYPLCFIIILGLLLFLIFLILIRRRPKNDA